MLEVNENQEFIIRIVADCQMNTVTFSSLFVCDWKKMPQVFECLKTQDKRRFLLVDKEKRPKSLRGKFNLFKFSSSHDEKK